MPLQRQTKSITPQDNWVPSWVFLARSKIVVQFPAMLLIHRDVSCMETTELSMLQHRSIGADVVRTHQPALACREVEALDRGTLSVSNTCLQSAPTAGRNCIQGGSLL